MFCSQGHGFGALPPSASSVYNPCVLSKNHKSRVQVSLFLKLAFPSGPPSKFLFPIWEICTLGAWEGPGWASTMLLTSHLGPWVGVATLFGSSCQITLCVAI